ncbi:hypothetical protein ABFS83_11G125300 [Erythranthe nasuta]
MKKIKNGIRAFYTPFLSSLQVRDSSKKEMAGKFEHLRKSMESYKSQMGSAMGSVPMQFILDHPYPPNSSVPIPHETVNDEKLLEAWPQIEQQILEWRKIVYLMSYLLRAHAEETILSLDKTRANLEKLRACEKPGPNLPYLQQLTALNEFVLQRGLEIIERGKAYEDQARAYAQENNDVAAMEWYAKHASTYLPSPDDMLEILLSVPVDINQFPDPNEGLHLMQQFHQLRQHYGDHTLDCGPLKADGLHIVQQFQRLQLHDKQQPPDWGSNGIMQIRIASSSSSSCLQF